MCVMKVSNDLNINTAVPGRPNVCFRTYLNKQSKQTQDKFLEKYESGFIYFLQICQTLNTHRAPLKLLEYENTWEYENTGHPPKIRDCLSWALVREASKSANCYSEGAGELHRWDEGNYSQDNHSPGTQQIWGLWKSGEKRERKKTY